MWVDSSLLNRKSLFWGNCPLTVGYQHFLHKKKTSETAASHNKTTILGGKSTSKTAGSNQTFTQATFAIDPSVRDVRLLPRKDILCGLFSEIIVHISTLPFLRLMTRWQWFFRANDYQNVMDHQILAATMIARHFQQVIADVEPYMRFHCWCLNMMVEDAIWRTVYQILKYIANTLTFMIRNNPSLSITFIRLEYLCFFKP